MRDMNRIPLDINVAPNPPRLTKGLKLLPPDPSLAEKMEEYTRLYRDIFFKRAGK